MKLFVFVVLLVSLSAQAKETVKITLFYESLCGPCVGLINTQLTPTYKKLSNVITMDLVPYGNSHVQNDDNKTIVCQHGIYECYGNRLHACAIQNHTQDDYMNFIGCNLEKYRPQNDTASELCAQKYNMSWDKIKACADGEEGHKLSLLYGKRTDKERIRMYTPNILFNGVYDQTREHAAHSNLARVVCQLLKEKPSACTALDL